MPGWIGDAVENRKSRGGGWAPARRVFLRGEGRFDLVGRRPLRAASGRLAEVHDAPGEVAVLAGVHPVL
jgi:hypothetical protein